MGAIVDKKRRYIDDLEFAGRIAAAANFQYHSLL